VAEVSSCEPTKALLLLSELDNIPNAKG